jgi:cyclase
MKTHQSFTSSKHFRLEQLADGVYAAIHIGGGAAIGNAGIIDLGDRTLVYDALFTPQAAADLLTAAESVTGRAVDAVVNSHYHNDHIWGNQVFDAHTDILSTEGTRQLILATGGHDDYPSFRANARPSLESTRAQLEAAQEEGERRQLSLWMDYHQGFLEAEPMLQVRAPNVTFDRRLALHGTDRSAELIAFDGGHTPSDIVLWLPQEGIAFMSDLLFIEHHPWLGCGDPDKLLDILDQISDLAPQVLVPGHGPVGGPDSLEQMKQYVRTLDGLARSMVQDGQPEAELDRQAVPEPFEDWLFAAFTTLNMRFLYERQASRQKVG